MVEGGQEGTDYDLYTLDQESENYACWSNPAQCLILHIKFNYTIYL